ncbi:general transcription factor II-I repeat domain-containing protein 2A-like isoform X5 [Oratosquilla oratoria]|uniref:general transcription factor II-I repeat domain-containing protein 2A-like isoform X5 n=1 Tax=Oratosquilla oratoria TaxID=337810 RepID=UPI003F777DBC
MSRNGVNPLYRMSQPPAKKYRHSNEGDTRKFKEYWTEKFGMREKDNKALCIFCYESVVCRTSSVKRHFETLHKDLNNLSEQERRELIFHELSNIRNQSDEGDIRKFKEDWTEKYGMSKKGNKAFCIFCSESVVCRTSSVKRHFETVHKDLNNKSEEERRELISHELNNKRNQSDSDTLVTSVSSKLSSNLVAASFEVSKIIAQHGRPLSDGEYIKEVWLECAPFLFDNLSEKEQIIQRIKELSVSRKTVKDRILKLERNTAKQLSKDLASCKFFSISVHEITDITSSTKLAIFARFCRIDKVCEELVNLVTLPECINGVEICKAVMNELSIRQIHISKVVSVTTDGSPNMIDKETGFVNLFTNYVGHPLVNFHCIVHEEALFANIGLRELQEVMQTVTKVVNYISASALNKKQFQNLLNEVDLMYKGLKMYNSAHWLNQSFVLKQFVECLDEINLLLTNQQITFQEMYDIMWVCKLMFFADFCKHLNDLNGRLQGSGKTLDIMFDEIKAFEMKLGVFKRDVDTEKFRYFPNLKRYISNLQEDDKMYHQCLQKLFLKIIESTVEQFSSRFIKFKELEQTAKFIKFPDSMKLDELNLQMFSWIDIDDFEMQLIDFQSSSIWSRKFVDLRADLENIEKERLETGVTERSAENEVLRIWNTVPETFVCLKNLATALLSIFLSTYSCESLFSAMNFTSRYRSSLTDDTSNACISLKVTKYKPDINYLSSVMQQQKSH